MHPPGSHAVRRRRFCDHSARYKVDSSFGRLYREHLSRLRELAAPVPEGWPGPTRSDGQVFGIEGNVGLTEYLLGKDVDLSSIGRRIGSTNLAIFPSFPAQVNSAELMVGERFEALISAARVLPRDALVISDLPPMFANDDAILVSEKLDGILIALEQGVTTKKQLQSALQFIEPTPVIGTVFDRCDGGLGDPYGYGGKYDGYYRSKA